LEARSLPRRRRRENGWNDVPHVLPPGHVGLYNAACSAAFGVTADARSMTVHEPGTRVVND